MTSKNNSAAADRERKIAALVRKLQDTERELLELTGGGVDAVATGSGQPFHRSEAQDKRRAAELQSGILNALPAHIALVDHDGVIIAVNESWRRFASANVLQSADLFVGQNYLSVCDRAAGDRSDESADAAEGIRQVLRGELSEFSLEYPCHSPTEKRWFRMTVTPVSLEHRAGAVVMHVNVTARGLVEEKIRQQEATQRRLADELTVETQRLHESQAVASVGSWETDAVTLTVTWTPETFRIFETTPEVFQPTHSGFLEFVHPDDRPKVNDAFAQSLGRPGRFSIEHRVLLPSGTIKYVEERWQAFTDATGKPVRALGTCQDITLRKQAEERLARVSRLYVVLSEVNAAIMRTTDLSSLLEAVCRIAIDTGKLRVAVVVGLDDRRGAPRILKIAGAHESYFADIEVKVAGGPLSDGTIGTALRTGRPDVCNDTLGESRMQPWRAGLLKHGFRSSASFPIRQGKDLFGVFSVFSDEPDYFLADEIGLLASVAENVSFAIEALRTEQDRREKQSLLANAERIGRMGTWSIDLGSSRLVWSEATCELFGIAPEDFQESFEHFVSFILPEDRTAYSEAHARVTVDQPLLEAEYRIWRRDGAVRWMYERGNVEFDAAGRQSRRLGMVMDITESKRAREERDRLFQLSPDMLCIANFDGVLEQVNPAWTQCLGWTAEELTSRPFRDFVVEDDKERTLQARAQIELGQELAGFENRYRHKEGGHRWLAWNVHPLVESRQIFGVARDVTQQREKDEQLRLLETCVSRLNDIVLITEADPVDEPGPRILYVNDAFVRVTGFTRDEVLGKSPRLLQGPKTQRDALARIRAAVQSGRSCREELINYTKSGAEYWIELELVPVADAKGRFTHLVAIERDITERKHAEAALGESQRKYRDLIETSHSVIWTVDMEGRFTFLNRASLAVFGRDPEEMIGRRFHEFVPEDQHRANDETLARMLRDGQDGVDYTNRIRRRDGRLAILSSNARLVRDAQGQMIGVSGMSQDTTEIVRAQEAILQSEARFRGLFDQAAVGMCLASTEGIFLRTNERFCEIVGCTAEEMLQRSCVATTYPDDREIEAKIVARMLAGELQTAAWEKRYLHKDGHPVWCNLTLSLLPAQEGQRQFVGVVEDITVRRTAVEHLRQREQLLGIAGRVARLGGWSVDLPEVRISWSDELCAIHDMPAGTEPGLDRALNFYAPGSRPVIESAFSLCLREGTPFDLELEMSTAKERRIWVRVIGQAERDAAGMIKRVQGATQDITEQRAAREIIQQSQSLQRIGGSIAKVGGWAIQIPGHELYWSDEIFDILEFPRGPVPALAEALNLYPEPSRSQLSAAIALCANEGTPFELELTIVTHKGRRIWAQCRAEAVRDTAGRITQVRGAFQDISEQKAAEEKIRDLGGRLVSTLEAITDAFFTLDHAWRFTYLNTEAEKLLARDRATLLSRNIWDEFPAGAGSTFQREYERAIEEMRAVSFEEYFAPLSKWFEVRAFPSPEGLAVYFHDVTALRNSRDALAASEKEFRNLAEAMPQIVWITRPDGWNIYFNQHWVDYTGMTLEESMGHAWNTPFHPADKQRAWDAWHHATATVGTYSLECRLRRKDGEYRWWLIRGEPQKDAAGKVIKWFGTCTDIHELKAADLEINRTNRALRMLGGCNEALIHASDETALLSRICDIAVRDGGYRMAWVGYGQEGATRTVKPIASAGHAEHYLQEVRISWNESDPAGTGPAGEVLRHGRTIIVVDTALDPSFAYWREAALRHGFRGVICLPLREKGRTFGILNLYAGEPIQANESELKLLQELADDLAFGISHLRSELERRAANATLREQAALLDITTEAIFVKDEEDRIIYWNRGAQETYGWTCAEALGKKAAELLQPDPTKLHEAHAVVAVDGKWEGELNKRTKDGRELTVLVRWTLVRDEASRPNSIFAINTDITERKKLEQQFLRAQRLESIGTLAGGIAHDLNNLLAPILMGVTLLRRFEVNPKSQSLISTMERSAERGVNLVKQVLSFARGVEGLRVSLEIKHIIREVEGIAESTFPKNITVETDMPPELWLVVGDPTQLHQVLVNLCVNARDAMQNGGILKISAANTEIDAQYAVMNRGVSPGRYVLVKVTDSGIGIPREIVDRIFEPFFTTKEPGRGTGLGLSTVIGIVRSHGGFVNVYSETGKGSTFRVYLPAQREDAPVGTTAAPAVPAEELPRGNGELILVVDDEETILTVTQQTLESFGYKVVTAIDGAQAIGIYATRRSEVAAVLTDMMMPIMDGPALIGALRRINPALKIVGASGLASNFNLTRLNNAGVDHFLAKPYSASVMLTTLKKLLAGA